MARNLLGRIASRSTFAVGKWQQLQPQLPRLNTRECQATHGSLHRLLSDMSPQCPFFLQSRRQASSQSAVAEQPGERFPCQHETRGELCKTLEKRNIPDHKKRLLAAKFELKRRLYKAICRDGELPQEVRDRHRSKLSRLPRNSAFVRLRNRCVSTGRPRSVLSLFRMSRITFREKASQGALMGVKKSSW
ncbi:mitochondrial ribosomal protein S14 [Wolffia australiana]